MSGPPGENTSRSRNQSECRICRIPPAHELRKKIIDCTEVRCQMPSSLQLNWELFSAYKNHTTLKGLVDISPGGMTPLVDLYFPFKDSGIVSITFLLGQIFICPNLKNIKLTRVINILLAVDADTLNNWARWSSGNPCLSLHMTIKNSSRGLKDLALPFFVSSLPSL